MICSRKVTPEGPRDASSAATASGETRKNGTALSNTGIVRSGNRDMVSKGLDSEALRLRFSRIRGQLVRFADYNAGLPAAPEWHLWCALWKAVHVASRFRQCDRYRLSLAYWRRFASTNAVARKDVPTADHKNRAKSNLATLENERSYPDNIEATVRASNFFHRGLSCVLWVESRLRGRFNNRILAARTKADHGDRSSTCENMRRSMASRNFSWRI